MSTRTVSKLIPKTVEAVASEYNSLVTGLGLAGVILHHEEAADADIIDTADATDAATTLALANELRTAYVAHIASTQKHSAADATNTVSAAAATDAASTQALANELKLDLNAHQANVTPHRGKGGQGSVVAAPQVIATADGTDAATTQTLTNAVKAAYNLHVRSGAQNLRVHGT